MKKTSIIFSVLIAAIVALIATNVIFGLKSIEQDEGEGASPDYHFQVISQGMSESFYSDFFRGARDAAAEKNIYVEQVIADSKNYESSVKAIKRAIYSGVDGVALQPQDSEHTYAAISEAKEDGISVVTFENDMYYFNDVMTVGSNSYETGYEMGKMCIEARGKKKTEIAIILGSTGDSGNGYKSMKVQGVADAISGYPYMSIDEVYIIDSEMFETDKLTGDILRENPDVNVILCMDEKNTPNVAQVLVDMSKVGDITVIGYGAAEQTIDYIERGVIYGTVCADGYQIGYNTVMQLYGQVSGESAITNFNTDIFRVTKENAGDYAEGEHEE